MPRQILALICGILAGFLLGRGVRLEAVASASDSNLYLGTTLSLLVLGTLTGAVTSLVSWKHTLGLPGMATSLAIAALEVFSTSPGARTVNQFPLERWVSFSVESVLILGSLLCTYAAAWAVDTFVVFRSLSVKPPPKQITWYLTMTRLLPGSLLTGVIGVLPILVLRLFLTWSMLISFAFGSFTISHITRARTTLWHAVSAPLCFAVLGTVVLAKPDLVLISPPPTAFALCGLGSAGAIVGHWIWTYTVRKREFVRSRGM